MIVNNKSVKGIYQFFISEEYEPGDFVVSGGVLYKVLRRSRYLEPDKNPENFEVYVGGHCADPEEYKKGKLSKDCLVSAVSLNSILSSYMSGFSESGMINNRITSDLRVISSSFAGSESVNAYTNSFDAIMAKSDLNNAIFHVDPSSEVETIIPIVEGETGVRYILRQYTYIDRDNETNGEPAYTRIQELTKISSIAVTTLYRYSLSSDGNFSVSNKTSWEHSGVSDKYKEEFRKLRGYYLSEIEKYKKLQLVMSNNFRFKKLSIPSNSSRLVFSHGRTGDLVISNLTTEDVPITFTLSAIDLQGFLRVYDITVDVSVLIRAKTPITYKVGCSDISLSVDFPDSNHIAFSLSGGAVFLTCYYQQLVRDIDRGVLLSRESNSLLINPSMLKESFFINSNRPVQINTKTVKGDASRDEIVVVRMNEVFKNIKASTTNTYTIRLSPDSELGCELVFVLVTDWEINLAISPIKSSDSNIISNLVEVKVWLER